MSRAYSYLSQIFATNINANMNKFIISAKALDNKIQ